MFIYNDNFVYYNKGEIIKIKKYDFSNSKCLEIMNIQN